MNNRFIRVVLGLGLVLWVIGSQAQTENPLLSWQIKQRITLPETLAMDPNARVMFADDLLLVADHGLQAGMCGRVLVYSINNNNRYRQVQQLDAADFNQACDEPDGFGFSVAYSDGNLFVGAPGDIFSFEAINAANALPDGRVYTYSLNAMRFGAEQIIPGIGDDANQAWGTSLEADGSVLLVQGNQLPPVLDAQSATLHGFASSNRLNQFNLAADGQWLFSRVFSNVSGEDTLEVYAQDFDINESGIFISKVLFLRANEERGFEFHSIQAEVYSLDSADGEQLPQEITTGRLVRFNTGAVPRTNTIVAQSESFLLAGLFSSSSIVGLTLSLAQPTLGFLGYVLENDTWVIAENEPRSFIIVPGELAHFSDEDAIVFNTRTARSDEILLETITSTSLGLALVQRERFVNESRLNINTLRRLIVNDDRMILIRNRDGRLILDALQGVPALDAAITQAWWFGPEFDGQGVTLEVLRGNRLLMHWFTYDLSGNQMWLRGVGRFENGVVNMQLVRAMGPRFPVGEFNPDDRVVQPWGDVTISFDGCTSGQLSYQSDEFGNGNLPLLPLTDTGVECNRGFLNVSSLEITGSYFDPSRGGEGFIFLPAQRFPDGNLGFFQARLIGLWLTYTPTGEQAWYYLGTYEGCSGFVNSFELCVIEGTQTPRSTTGPVFGPAYNPNDRISVPWGLVGPLTTPTFGRQGDLNLRFDNPHGSGFLLLEQASEPIF